MSNRKRIWARIVGIAAGSAALMVAGSGAASAHVTVTAESVAAGSTAVLAFSLSHGCDGSPTTRVTIRMPAGINSVTPTTNAGWTVTKVNQALPTPGKDQQGNTVTERVDQVVFTAKTPLPDGYRDVLSVSVPLAADSAGQVFAFPVLQTCQKGETAWVDLAAPGQNPDDLEAPAPTITVGTAEASGHHASRTGGETRAEEANQFGDGAAAAATNGAYSGFTWSLAGFVAGLAGVAMGTLALVRGKRPSR